jgi:hypothetical protein
MIGFLVSYSYGKENKKVKWGFSILGGRNVKFFHKKPNFTVLAFLPRLDLALDKNWDLDFSASFLLPC